jgi:hypothetical protein
MSTEREAISIIGYSFTHQELLSLIEIHNEENIWTEEWLEENKKYLAMVAETFSDHLGMEAHYDEDYDKCHLLGFKLKDGMDYVEAINFINDKSIQLMESFKTDQKPKLNFEIYSC